MRRGQIRAVALTAQSGSGAGPTCQAVIISNDAANAAAAHTDRGVVTVVPVTTNTGRVHPFQVFLPAGLTGLPHDAKAQAEQVRSVTAGHVGERLGELPPALLTQLDQALRVHLDL